MTKKEKRLRKIRQNRRNVRFDDFVSALQDYGFSIREGKGSHVMAERLTDNGTVSIALVKPHKGKYVKVTYVTRALKEIDTVIEEQQTVDEDEIDD
ncbi:MAG: type II toxin-antitoxin system HicA family toxin [Chloroflexota bacterium]